MIDAKEVCKLLLTITQLPRKEKIRNEVIKLNIDYYLQFDKDFNMIHLLMPGPVLVASINKDGIFISERCGHLLDDKIIIAFDELLVGIECNWERVYVEIQSLLIELV